LTIYNFKLAVIYLIILFVSFLLFKLFKKKTMGDEIYRKELSCEDTSVQSGS